MPQPSVELLNPAAFKRARSCFDHELAALRRDECMVKQPATIMRRPRPLASAGGSRFRSSRATAASCARRPEACVITVPRKTNPLSDVHTKQQAEDAHLPKGPWTREELNQRPNTLLARATAAARWGRVVGTPPHAPPVYVLSAHHLTERHKHVAETLAAVSLGEDVTLVLCADAAELRCLDATRLGCLHPTALRRDWHNASARHGQLLAFGTLSLALKHKLAVADAARRGLHAALVVEDDVTMRKDLWEVLHTPLPADAEIAFVGRHADDVRPQPQTSRAAPCHLRLTRRGPQIGAATDATSRRRCGSTRGRTAHGASGARGGAGCIRTTSSCRSSARTRTSSSRARPVCRAVVAPQTRRAATHASGSSS